MILWYGCFLGDFKSPTFPDIPAGKEKNKIEGTPILKLAMVNPIPT